MSLDPVEFIKSEEGQEFLLKELKRKGVTAPDDREDIRSAFTLKLLESSAEFRGESSVKVFLSRSLNNAIIDFRRRRYGSQLGRNIKIPQSVHGQGETAVLVYQLLYNKGQRSLREAWEAYQNEKPENPLSWNAFQILVARLPEAKDRLRHFDDINDTQIPMVAADPTHAIHHRTLLRAALAELTPNERMALVIKTEDGLDADSCKKIFGMAIGWEACRKRVQRIMDRVKAVLESRGLHL